MEIRQIIDGAESMSMVMPEFQREYVWTLDAAKSLMASLYKGYPTGSLLFWETETPPEIKNNAVDVNKLGLTKVILDGQQRLTTLREKSHPITQKQISITTTPGIYISMFIQGIFSFI